MSRVALLGALALCLVSSRARAERGPDEEGSLASARAEGARHLGDHLRRSLLAADAALNDRIRQVGIVHGLLEAITDDAVVNVPGEDIARGRGAVEAALRHAIPTPADAAFDRSTYTGNVSHDTLFGYTFGRGTAKLRQPDGTVLDRYTLYTVAWRRHGDRWRVEATMWNTSRAAPTDPPAGFALFEPGDRGTPRWAPRRWNAASVIGADADFADLSLAQGYTVAFSSYTAPDGVSVGGPVYWGFDEVVGIAFAGFEPVETLAWAPAYGDSTWSGDLGWSIGRSHYTLRNPDGSVAVESFGKYLTVWARQPDGRWKFILDGGNARPATPTP